MRMAQKKRKTQASAALTRHAHQVLQEYRQYGVKYVLSVGLELFDALDPADREARTRAVMKQDMEDRRAAKEAAIDEAAANAGAGDALRGRPGTRRTRS
jgi:hypothetical protein